MENALIVSYTANSITFLKDSLSEASIYDITTVSNANEARRLLINKYYDLCIINAPLPDEFGESLAVNIAAKGNTEVIFIVKAELFDDVSIKVEDYGVITLSKPLNKAFFWNALKLAKATHKKLQTIQNENKKLVQKIEDIRIVDRAKCILISHMSMTEPEAHRYIEKQAMDMRQTRREVAEGILKSYEN